MTFQCSLFRILKGPLMCNIIPQQVGRYHPSYCFYHAFIFIAVNAL